MTVGIAALFLHKKVMFICSCQPHNLIYVGDSNESNCYVGRIKYASLSMHACWIKKLSLVKC